MKAELDDLREHISILEGRVDQRDRYIDYLTAQRSELEASLADAQGKASRLETILEESARSGARSGTSDRG